MTSSGDGGKILDKTITAAVQTVYKSNDSNLIIIFMDEFAASVLSDS
jgi:hypothetical protein